MKSALLFLLKFAAAAPICLVVWWWCSPFYAWIIGQLSGTVLRVAFGADIRAMHIEPAGLLRTGTQLIYTVGERPRPLEIVAVITSIPSYLALVLATAGLGWRRLLKIAALGAGILAITHVVFVIVVFQFGALFQQYPQALQVLIMLPFFLWIVLAYWNQIAQYFSDDTAEDA